MNSTAHEAVTVDHDLVSVSHHTNRVEFVDTPLAFAAYENIACQCQRKRASLCTRGYRTLGAYSDATSERPGVAEKLNIDKNVLSSSRRFSKTAGREAASIQT